MAAAQGAGPLNGADLKDRLIKDGEFGVAARYWTGRVQVEIGATAYLLSVSNGKVSDVTDVRPGGDSQADVRMSGPEAVWRDPRAVLSMLFATSSGLSDRLMVQGDRIGHVAPYQQALEDSDNEILSEVIRTLSPREQTILQLRFGLDDGRSRTLEEVGKEFHVTRERIRQIEAKALRKLRHPSRSRKLKDYLD